MKKLLLVLQYLLFMAIGAGLGLFVGKMFPDLDKFDAVLLVIAFFISIFLSIIIHEAGHLLFGLLTGYSFSSFRVANFMWYKADDNKIKLTKFNIPGTGGQCIMIPPKNSDHIPYFWYNAGGGLLNLIVALLSYAVYFVLPAYKYIPLIFMLVNLFLALANLIPMKGLVLNDGYNIILLAKSEKARKMLALSLHVTEAQIRGIRLKDMDSELFSQITDDESDNAIVAVGLIYKINRYLDQGKYEEAYSQMKEILANEKIVLNDIHKKMIQAEVLYFDILKGNFSEVDNKFTKELEKLIRSFSKSQLFACRFLYCYELIFKNNILESEKWLEKFETIAKKYPYKGDLLLEKELLELTKTGCQQFKEENSLQIKS